MTKNQVCEDTEKIHQTSKQLFIRKCLDTSLMMPTFKALSVTFAIIREDGEFFSSVDPDSATHKKVEASKSWLVECSHEDKRNAVAALEWALQLDLEDPFLCSLYELARSEYFNSKKLPTFVMIAQGYLAHVKRVQEAPNLYQEHYANTGNFLNGVNLRLAPERTSIKCHLIAHTKTVESYASKGARYHHQFEDDLGRVFLWSTNIALGIASQSSGQASFVIKGHSQLNRELINHIGRVSFNDIKLLRKISISNSKSQILSLIKGESFCCQLSEASAEIANAASTNCKIHGLDDWAKIIQELCEKTKNRIAEI